MSNDAALIKIRIHTKGSFSALYVNSVELCYGTSGKVFRKVIEKIFEYLQSGQQFTLTLETDNSRIKDKFYSSINSTPR